RNVGRGNRDRVLGRRLVQNRLLRRPDGAVVLLRVLPRRKEQPVAAADHHRRRDRPVHAKPRRDLHGRRIALIRVRPVHAGEDEPAFERGTRIAVLANGAVERLQRGAGRVRIETDRDVVVLLAQAALVLEAQTVVEREARADAPVVLHVAAAVVQVIYALAAVEIDRAAARRADEEAGEVVAADAARSARELVLERVRAGGHVQQRRGDLHTAEVAAELPGVNADQL